MPALDFSEIEDDPKPAVTFDDIPDDAPKTGLFADIPDDPRPPVFGPPDLSGAPGYIAPADYLKGATPSFQMSPSGDPDPYPEMTAAMKQHVEQAKAQGTWGIINEPLITADKRKTYSDWLAANEAKIPASLDLTGTRKFLDLTLGPEKAKDLRAGVTKGAAELVYGFTSPLGIGTLGMGTLPNVVQKAAAIGFATDMVRHLPEAVEAIGNAKTVEEKSKAITSALGAAGMIGLLAGHTGGRPEAGGRVPLGGARVPGTDINLPALPPEQIAANGAPATAAAIKAAEQPPPVVIDYDTARGDSKAAIEALMSRHGLSREDAAMKLSEARRGYGLNSDLPQPPPLPEQTAAPIIKGAPEELEPTPFVPPETQTGLDPAQYPAQPRPIAGLEVSQKDLPQFKAGADPVTGEVSPLEGRYDPLAAGNITEWVRDVDPQTGKRLPQSQWRRIVASGRHRYGLAKRSGQEMMNTQQVFESEGWTQDLVARLDAELNIKDEKGSIYDYANYFSDPAAAARAASEGLLSRPQGKRGFKIGTLGSPNLLARFLAEHPEGEKGHLSEQHALAIVEAAGKDEAAQRVGMSFVDSHPRATMQEVANRVKASFLVESRGEAPAQGEFWDSGDSVMAALDKAAEQAAKFQAQARDDVRTLKTAYGKSEKLKLTPEERKRFGIHDTDSVLSIRKALERLQAEADAWDNWHLDPEKTKQVLEASGTAKELSVQPKPAEEPAPVVGTRVAKIALADSNGKRVAEGELGQEHKALLQVPGTMDKLLEAGDDPFSAKHGFLDENGNWMSRAQAWEVAKAAGQLDPDFVVREEARAKAAGKVPELHSQHLQKPTEEASFFEQMGMDQPAPPVPDLPKPAARPTAADVTFSGVSHPDVESVSKAKVGTSTGTFVEHPDRIELKDLVSVQQGTGGGSAIIDALKGKGKPIELVAGRRSTDTPIEQLTRFYESRGFREVEGSPGHFRWEPGRVELTKQAAARGDKLVNVDPVTFDAAFKKDPGFYVEPGGGGQSAKPGAYDRFGEWLKEGKPIEASEVTVHPDGSVSFTNGRHRYAWMRDHGREEIPIAMDADSIENARKNGLLTEKPSPEEPPKAADPAESTDAGAEVVRLPNEKYPDKGVPLLEIMVRQKDGQFQHFTSANVHDVGIGHPWSKGFATREEAVADAVAEVRGFLPEARKRKGMSAADLKRLDKIEEALPEQSPRTKLIGTTLVELKKLGVDDTELRNALRDGGANVDDFPLMLETAAQGLPRKKVASARDAVAKAVEDYYRELPADERARVERSKGAQTGGPKMETESPTLESERPLPQAAGASNIKELQQEQGTFAATVYAGLAKADGAEPSRDVWERNFLRHYPELEGDVDALNRNWTMAQEAFPRFRDSAERKPMSAVIGEIMGELRGQGVTGIKNRQADIVRRQRGLPAAYQQARRAWGPTWDLAMRKIDDDPQLQDRLVKRLRDNPDAVVEDWEIAALLHRQIDLENRFDAAVDRVNNLPKEDSNGIAQAWRESRDAQDLLIDILDINKRVGTAQARAFNARKMMGRRDYTLERMIAESRASKRDDLTPEERTKIEEEFKTIVETDSKLEDIDAAHDQKNAEDHADAAVEDLKAEVAAEKPETKTFEPEVLSLAERIAQRLEKAADDAGKRISERLKQMRQKTFLNPLEVGLVYDIGVWGAAKLARGILDFGRFSTAAIAKFGKEVEPYLQLGWDAANKRVDQAVEAGAPREKRDAVKKAVKKLDPTQVREKTAESMKKKYAKDPKLNALRPYVQKIALAFVRDGITEREPLVDAVHQFVEEVVPDATRRQTMDLISGYGDFSPLDKEAAKVTLRERKGELQQIAKMEDIIAKRPLQKTGAERRTKGNEERRMEAEVNELKRKYGVVTTDPETQLKSALDAIKTRMKHQISDLADWIETGKKEPTKTKTEYDAQAEGLKAVMDRMQQTLRDIEGKPEMTDAERVRIAMKAAEESIAEYERRIKEKDFSGERFGPKTPPDAILDAMHAKRDALKAEFEELRAADEDWRAEKEFDSLMKQGDTIEQMLKSGKIDPVKPGDKPASTEPIIQEARARLDGLRKQLSDARASSPAAFKAKIDAAVKAVERSIADYDKRLQTGAIDPVTKKPAVNTPQIERLKAERDALKKYLTDLRNAAKPKLTKEQIALKSIKTRLTKSTADIKARTLAGDFAPRPVKRIDLSKDPDAVKAKTENILAKAKFEKRKQIWEKQNLTGLAKAMDTAAESLNAHRAIVTSFDFSGVLRQGGMITTGVGNQGRVVAAMKAMAEAASSDEGFARVMAKLELRENSRNGYYDTGNLFLAQRGDVKLTAREEAYLSNWAQHIPGVGASERAYVAFLNHLRADSFDAMVDSLTRGGWFHKGGSATPKELRAIGDYINIATGRGSLGKAAPAATTLATLFFSPRLLASRFQLIMAPFTGFRFGGGSLRTRALIAKEYSKTLTGLGVILGLGSMMGGRIGTNPDSSDFGKLIFGNTRVDMLFGLSQVTTLLSRLHSGKIVGPGNKVMKEHEQPLEKFLRSKLAPIPGMIWDARDIHATGKAPAGHPQTYGQIAAGSFAPLSFGDIFDVMKANGVPAGTALSLLSIFGAGVQVHDDKKKKKVLKPQDLDYWLPWNT